MTSNLRGRCGTCHWWVFTNVIPGPEGEVRNGICHVNPPVPHMIAIPEPGSSIRTGQPRMIPQTVGIVPPALEIGTCEKWRAQGTFPPPEMGLQ